MSTSDSHHPDAPTELEARTLALESLLVEKGLLTSEAVDETVAPDARAIVRVDEETDH